MLLNYAKNIYSQNGEDGIIMELFKRLNIDGGFLVEFGATDGVIISNTYYWLKHSDKFKVLEIEGQEYFFKYGLKKLEDEFPGRVIAVNEWVTPQNIERIFDENNVPLDFELLSIDIDSHDLEVWDAIKKYKPKIVVIEINSGYPPGVYQTHNIIYQGNSFSSTLDVGKMKGYTFVCHNCNMFFVRNDLAHLVNEDIKDPADLFCWNWNMQDRPHNKPYLMNPIHLIN